MELWYKLIEVVAFAVFMHGVLKLISEKSVAWIDLVEKVHRPWIVLSLLVTVLLLAAIHFIR